MRNHMSVHITVPMIGLIPNQCQKVSIAVAVDLKIDQIAKVKVSLKAYQYQTVKLLRDLY